ncbi:hypothetical protein SLEP1_g56674 [Rubroshorea leprosula]|uniref:Uncharacterized protein n=1 Tax=Rubroshorea leprosula TaxID=152421 RepID=A0AAV5MM66_9ROSI|nr:hypothetical protein SLEP1_g56674 [Rubroshorea leprosula]
MNVERICYFRGESGNLKVQIELLSKWKQHERWGRFREDGEGCLAFLKNPPHPFS